MADLDIVEYDEVSFAISDGEEVPSYEHPAVINTDKGVQFTAEFADDLIPDKTNLGGPRTVYRNAQSISFSISGAGKVDRNSVGYYLRWLASGASKEVKIRLGAKGAAGSVEITCSIKCTGFNVRAQHPASADADITIISDGFKAEDIQDYV